MAKIQFETGQTVEFDGTPTPADIEEVARHLTALTVAPHPTAPTPHDPTEGMSTGEKIAAGAGRAIVHAGRGLGQLFGLVSQQELNEARRLEEPLMRTGAGQVGNVLGTVGMFAPTALIPGVNTVTGAALLGGAGGAALTPGDLKERALAGAGGAIGGAVGQAIPTAYRAIKSAVAPLTESGQGRILGDVLVGDVGAEAAPGIAARLRGAEPLVPGSMPTAAEVAGSGGLSARQRWAASANPQAYEQRALEQIAARKAALQGIAQDPASLEAAVATRRAASAPLYAASDAQMLPETPALAATLGKLPPAVVARAEALAKMRGEPFSVSQAAMPAAPHGNVVPIGLPPETVYPGSSLAYLQKALSAQIKDPTLGLSTHETQAMTSLKQELGTHLGPLYAEAEQTYASLSKPISQMKVGQALLDKVSPALSDHGALGEETKAAFAKALRDSGKVVKTATGMKRLAIEDIMTPEQMRTLNAVAEDLARKANLQKLGAPVGSPTHQFLSMEAGAQAAGIPSALKSLGASFIPGAHLRAEIYRGADQKLKERLAQVLLDPRAAGGAMKASLDRARLARLLQGGGLAPFTGALPGQAGIAASMSMPMGQ